MADKASDERLGELLEGLKAHGYPEGSAGFDFVILLAEIQRHRAHAQQAAEIVDLEGIEELADCLYLEKHADALRSYLAALLAGVQECPRCVTGNSLAQGGEVGCPTCHGTGRVIILAAPAAEESEP